MLLINPEQCFYGPILRIKDPNKQTYRNLSQRIQKLRNKNYLIHKLKYLMNKIQHRSLVNNSLQVVKLRFFMKLTVFFWCLYLWFIGINIQKKYREDWKFIYGLLWVKKYIWHRFRYCLYFKAKYSHFLSIKLIKILLSKQTFLKAMSKSYKKTNSEIYFA